MKLKMVERRMVLLPGLDGTGQMFTPLLKALKPPVQPLVIRFPRERPQNYQQLLHVIREQIPWDQPYILVAESFSGPLAVYFAQAQWENLQAVVLCSSFIRNPLSEFQNWLYSFAPRSLLSKPWTTSMLCKLMLDKDGPVELQDALRSCMKSIDPKVIASRIELVMSSDASVALQECRCPILYLQATRDRLIGRRGWDMVSQARNDVSLAEIEGPHLLLQARPQECLAIIEKFLAALEKQQPQTVPAA